MLVKGLVFTALVASTPIAFVATQDPRPNAPQPDASALQRLQEQQAAQARDLRSAQRELDAARSELQRLRTQLDRALDALDKNFQPERDRHCAPSRNRALMSHYQWLRDEGHAQRASGTLAKVVDQVGEDPNQRNSVAWDLMTDKATVGKFDDVALAIAQRMEKANVREPHQLDTIALAYSLAGDFERAIELQKQAIDAGGHGDDFRRRLRTYEAARDAVARHKAPETGVGPALVAAHDDQDD
jgi:tetratricopeptide (TPR) repeat protein